MHFKEIPLEIPEAVQNLMKNIRYLEPGSYLAGGFLSDLYMKRSFKDVDIFIPYSAKTYRKVLNFFGLNLDKRQGEDEFEHYFDSYLVDVVNFEYDGFQIQLIFTNYTENPTYRFDFRFREFFYDGEKVFATNEALLDIENKQFVFGITEEPLRSLKRLNNFSKKYTDFQIEEKSFNRLIASISHTSHELTFKKIEESFNLQHPSSYIEKLVVENIKDNKLIFKTEPIRKDFIDYSLKNISLNRKTVERIFYKNDFSTKHSFYTLPENFYDEKIKEAEIEAINTIIKQRVRLLGEVSPIEINKFMKYSSSLTKENMNRMREFVRTKLSNSSNTAKIINNAITQFKKVVIDTQKINRKIYFTISNDIPLDEVREIESYLNNDLIYFKLEGSTNWFISSILYNKKTDIIEFSSGITDVESEIYKEILVNQLKTAHN